MCAYVLPSSFPFENIDIWGDIIVYHRIIHYPTRAIYLSLMRKDWRPITGRLIVRSAPPTTCHFSFFRTVPILAIVDPGCLWANQRSNYWGSEQLTQYVCGSCNIFGHTECGGIGR